MPLRERWGSGRRYSYDYRQHFVYFGQLAVTLGGVMATRGPGLADGMSFQIGRRRRSVLAAFGGCGWLSTNVVPSRTLPG